MNNNLEFKNKDQFVKFAKKYFNVTLENDKTNMFNRKQKYLYTNLGKNTQNTEFKSYLKKNGFECSEHINGFYWIKFKK